MKKEKRKYASARERARRQTSGFQAAYLAVPPGVSIFGPKEGLMFLDILDYEVGDGNPNADPGMLFCERTFWAHRGIGANSESHLCLAKTLKKPCPVCEFRARLRRSDDENDEKLVADLAPKERQLFNIINLKEPDKGVQLFEISNFCFGKPLFEAINSADEDEEKDFDNFSRHANGMTLKVSFVEEKRGGYSFIKASNIVLKPRKRQYDEEEMLEKVICLDEVLIETPYKKLKQILLEAEAKDDEEEEEEEEDEIKSKARAKRRQDEDDDEEEDEEEESSKSKTGKSSKASSAKKPSDDDDEDEDEDEEEVPVKKRKKVVDEEDEDDEDEVPVKKKAKASKADEDDEEEDDEDEEEDEDEDEKPVKKKAKASKEDEEDDWSDFDDDEDDKPVKKKSKS